MKRLLLNDGRAFRKKKRLGQHFLKNKKILGEMAQTAEITKKDVVLEVGPGLGSLTEILAGRAKKIIAIEKDRDLIPILREKFRDYKNVEVIEGDILKISNFKFLISNQIQMSKFKIVANLPYYITSRFLRLFLSNAGFRPKMMVLMIQKEVAERICSKPPHMNLLALSIRLYATPKIIRKVSKNQFSPSPKVDSAILKISDLGKSHRNAEKILSLARQAFQQKRKMLRHSLKNKLSPYDIDRFGNKRPEELSPEDWRILYILVAQHE